MLIIAYFMYFIFAHNYFTACMDAILHGFNSEGHAVNIIGAFDCEAQDYLVVGVSGCSSFFFNDSFN